MKFKTLLSLAIMMIAPNLNAQKPGTAHFRFRATQKVDILFVIDNSGTMENSQAALTSALPRFIEKLKASNLDFHIGVTGTDAWRAQYQSNPESRDLLSSLRMGELNFSTNPLTYVTKSGVRLIDPNTPDMAQVFSINIQQGIKGTGDERAFQSLRTVLGFSGNADFRRSDASLSVIVISDEDDFSANTSSYVPGSYASESDSDPVELPESSDPLSLWALYQDSSLTPVSEFKSYLDQIAGEQKASVSLIAVLDVPCKQQLNSSLSGRMIGRRYLQLAQQTQGYQGSICEVENSISQYADFLSASVAEAPTYDIQLDHSPILETIIIKINGRLIHRDAVNGWTFDETKLVVTLHGTAVPQKEDIVSVTYDFVN